MQLQMHMLCLLLQPLTAMTAPGFVALVNDKQVAGMTINISYPCTKQNATAYLELA